MKIATQSAVATLLIAACCANASAHGWERGYRPPPQRFHEHRSGSWVAPLLVLGIAGAAISAAASQPRPAYSPPPVSYAQPAVGYVAPAVSYAAPPVNYAAPPAPAYAYYCQSAGQYYPQVGYCNEGWQLVAPAR